MKHAMVIYESGYGNTQAIATAIAEGLRKSYAVQVVSVSQTSAQIISRTDLIVIGGPTHVHGLSRPRTRQTAVATTAKPGNTLTPDAKRSAVGLREWFELVRASGTPAVAFDTRLDGPALMTGRASRENSRRLAHNGFRVIKEPMSFLVPKGSALLPDQIEAARWWGEVLAGVVIDQGHRETDAISSMS